MSIAIDQILSFNHNNRILLQQNIEYAEFIKTYHRLWEKKLGSLDGSKTLDSLKELPKYSIIPWRCQPVLETDDDESRIYPYLKAIIAFSKGETASKEQISQFARGLLLDHDERINIAVAWMCKKRSPACLTVPEELGERVLEGPDYLKECFSRNEKFKNGTKEHENASMKEAKENLSKVWTMFGHLHDKECYWDVDWNDREAVWRLAPSFCNAAAKSELIEGAWEGSDMVNVLPMRSDTPPELHNLWAISFIIGWQRTECLDSDTVWCWLLSMANEHLRFHDAATLFALLRRCFSNIFRTGSAAIWSTELCEIKFFMIIARLLYCFSRQLS